VRLSLRLGKTKVPNSFRILNRPCKRDITTNRGPLDVKLVYLILLKDSIKLGYVVGRSAVASCTMLPLQAWRQPSGPPKCFWESAPLEGLKNIYFRKKCIGTHKKKNMYIFTEILRFFYLPLFYFITDRTAFTWPEYYNRYF
jgi:hypothetical protein